MPRQSQPDQYVFTFGADGVVTAVAEVGRNGRLDNEKIERGESYRLIDGFVVKTEVDGREQEWEVYADRDGDGRWVEVGEGEGAFHQGLLALFGGTPVSGAAPPAAPGGEEYVFQFDATGAVTAVFERERGGRLDREDIERDESYALVNGFVVKTEIDDGRMEQTYYADPEGDGVWVEIAQVLPGASGVSATPW
ncbi:MAG: hypothetical protein JNL41_00345 [Phenylobacterium sp.]|uniref:hypothetical protein n=1 Tax=Phenylobacterium sp. TaxID=1871053 RepID=UPI001A3E2FC2|nr:hypothetical protein [Phenylobacterium sp.]MBL8552694.1 hypothetical protein [Phenylobacterium sp.]